MVRVGIVALGITPWNFRFQRTQQLLSRLAKSGCPILYVNELCLPREQATLRYHGTNLYSMDPVGRGYAKDFLKTARGRAILAESIRENLRLIRVPAYILWVDSPYWEPLLAQLNPVLVLFNCMDEFAGFGDLQSEATTILNQERALMATAEATLFSSRVLLEKKGGHCREALLLSNGADLQHFSRACLENLPPPVELAGLKGPVAGYFGAISDWFDPEPIAQLAAMAPQLHIVLIGAVTTNLTGLKAYPNIYFLGEKPYRDLPAYLRCFNVCLIPFKNNELTQATNPVKLYEYLAAGKAVVATDLPEIRQFADVVTVVGNPADFAAAVIRLIQEGDQAAEVRRQRVQLESWEQRLAQLKVLLQRLLAHPRTHAGAIAYTVLDSNSEQ